MFAFFVRRKEVERVFASCYVMIFMVGDENKQQKNNDDIVR
jgi:hypothetical protein